MSQNGMKTHQKKKTLNQIYLCIRKVQKVRRSKRVLMRVMMSENKICQQVVNVLINNAHQRKSIKKLGQESNKINTGSFAKIAMRITITIFIASSASKFIQTTAKIKMMTNGLGVITVNAGY